MNSPLPTPYDGDKVYLEPSVAAPLAALWSKFPALPWTTDAAGPLEPLYPVWIKKGQALVIGLNPSYNVSHRHLASYEPDYGSAGYFKRMAGFMHKAAAHHQLLDQVAAPHQQLFTLGDFEWSHLDMLYVRATQQKLLEQQLWQIPDAADFIWEQLQLTKKLLVQAQPALLLVANRFAQTLTGFRRNKQTNDNEWMGLQFSAEPEVSGAYRITGSTTAGQSDTGEVEKLIGTPVFFTNSFAGTSPRSAMADESMAQQIGLAHLREGSRYFEQWHME